jgi:hypothetical protein
MDMMTVNLLLIGLATWRLTSLLADEEGPWNIFGKLRKLLGVEPEGQNFFSKMFNCHFCLSMWSAIAVCLFYFLTSPVVVLPLAASAISIMIYTFAEPYMS